MWIKNLLKLFLFLNLCHCAQGGRYMQTVDKLDLDRFMGDWYVIAGRTTPFEKGAHNSLEHYDWNDTKQRIDVTFTYNKNSVDGPKKTIKQKAWVHNQDTKAHWKVQPLWPFKLDYIILEVDPDYQWTAVGVPNQNYLWIMSRSKTLDEAIYKNIIKTLDDKNYNVKGVEKITHKL